MIQAVIFDFGNVIYGFDPLVFVNKVAPFSTLQIPDVKTRLRQSTDLFERYETGRMTSEEFFHEITSRLGLGMSREAFIEAFCSIFTPIPSTMKLIEQLKSTHRLGLLSNTSAWHFEHVIATAPVYPLFETVTLSFEVHAMKPAEAIYRDALQKLNLPAADCVYIDDIKENADAATALGMVGIHYTSHDALVQALNGLFNDANPLNREVSM